MCAVADAGTTLAMMGMQKFWLKMRTSALAASRTTSLRKFNK